MDYANLLSHASAQILFFATMSGSGRLVGPPFCSRRSPPPRALPRHGAERAGESDADPARGGTGHQNRHRAHAGGPGARTFGSGPMEHARSAGSREKPRC